MLEPARPLTFNHLAAERLREAAMLLAHQDDNPYRVAAYRRAAEIVKLQSAQHSSRFASPV
jgi:DNA polymerase/3'-5' exonuclease PolX